MSEKIACGVMKRLVELVVDEGKHKQELVLLKMKKLWFDKYKNKNKPVLEINENRLKFSANLQDRMREPAQRHER